jgi:L-rhamnose 1-dehydrogenase
MKIQMRRFEEKVALVTGAASGIGQATAVRLASEGAFVGVNYHGLHYPAETLDQIKEIKGKAFPVNADMREPDQVVAMVQETARQGGRFDYLVSNAAINPYVKWNEASVEDYDRIQEINLRGTWVVCQAVARQMIHEGHPGAIVCVSSMSAWVGALTQEIYCATKAGICMIAKSLAIALGPRNIRINVVLPGNIATPMAKELQEPGSTQRKYYETRTPLGRIGEPGEVAAAIAFLLSDDASYISSSELLVDGGYVTNAE